MKTKLMLFAATLAMIGLAGVRHDVKADSGCQNNSCSPSDIYICGQQDPCGGCTSCQAFTACGDTWDLDVPPCDSSGGRTCWQRLDPHSCGCNCVHSGLPICGDFLSSSEVVQSVIAKASNNVCWYVNMDGTCWWSHACKVPRTPWCQYDQVWCELDGGESDEDHPGVIYQSFPANPTCVCYPPVN